MELGRSGGYYDLLAVFIISDIRIFLDREKSDSKKTDIRNFGSDVRKQKKIDFSKGKLHKLSFG